MNIKQTIVIRKDLNMRKGKMAAQAAHASMAAIFNQSKIANNEMVVPYDGVVKEWFEDKFTKICLGCNSEEELTSLYLKALEAGLTAVMITDAGLTEFHGAPTKTCIAIGPNNADDINTITKDLKLL